MPLFMDVHEIDGGVAMDDVAKAHLADLQTQAPMTCAGPSALPGVPVASYLPGDGKDPPPLQTAESG